MPELNDREWAYVEADIEYAMNLSGENSDECNSVSRPRLGA